MRDVGLADSCLELLLGRVVHLSLLCERHDLDLVW